MEGEGSGMAVYIALLAVVISLGAAFMGRQASKAKARKDKPGGETSGVYGGDGGGPSSKKTNDTDTGDGGGGDGGGGD